MRQPVSTLLQRVHPRRSWPLFVLIGGGILAGCFFSPVGTNSAQVVLPVPGADGNVTVNFTPTTTPKEVEFSIEAAPGATAPLAVQTDDSTNTTRSATFNTATLGLGAGLYIVDVSLDNATPPAAKIGFIVPQAGASGVQQPSTASGTSSTTGTSGTTTGPYRVDSLKTSHF